MKLQFKGFSLIELMIVIAIIGVLASLAVPSYRNYIVRSHVTELIDTVGSAETAVNDFIQGQGLTGTGVAITGTAPQACGAALTSTYANGVASTNNLAKGGLAINASCVITATGTTTAGGTVITATPYLNSDGSITWKCTSNGSPYAPSTCQ